MSGGFGATIIGQNEDLGKTKNLYYNRKHTNKKNKKKSKQLVQMNQQQGNYNLSPMRQNTPSQSGNYVKQFVPVTPPRPNNGNQATPSTAQTAQTHYSINGSAPSRFNIALDQVCLLGHEMDTMRKNFELVQVELQQWKEKCALIKVISSTPPPGTNYSPTRVNKLQSDVQNQFQNYQSEINKLHNIINNVNSELTSSADKIKLLEKRVGEMNKIELDMLQAKKQALELDNRNRFQELEINEIKQKLGQANSNSDELLKQLNVFPHLKESVNVLEEENKKLIFIIQQKDDQINKQDQKHMQLTKMYQENLEKTNQVSQQLREVLGENDEISNEIDKTHSIAGIIYFLRRGKGGGRNKFILKFNTKSNILE